MCRMLGACRLVASYQPAVFGEVLVVSCIHNRICIRKPMGDPGPCPAGRELPGAGRPVSDRDVQSGAPRAVGLQAGSRPHRLLRQGCAGDLPQGAHTQTLASFQGWLWVCADAKEYVQTAARCCMQLLVHSMRVPRCVWGRCGRTPTEVRVPVARVVRVGHVIPTPCGGVGRSAAFGMATKVDADASTGDANPRHHPQQSCSTSVPLCRPGCSTTEYRPVSTDVHLLAVCARTCTPPGWPETVCSAIGQAPPPPPPLVCQNACAKIGSPHHRAHGVCRGAGSPWCRASRRLATQSSLSAGQPPTHACPLCSASTALVVY